ncbi:MAG: pyridoxal phosphate-dependent aminotransferase, partial [Polyangiaceae bacterium]
MTGIPFSRRTDGGDVPNALTTSLARLRAEGRPILDLTVANPTAARIPYDDDAIVAAFASPAILAYEPLPFGLPSAREAVARTYDALGERVDADDVVLTASTSEAYAFLFKVLCDPGDEILIPLPSYPLFEWLARFEHVKLVPYRLRYDGAWHVDRESVLRSRTDRTRAVVVVSPNNPTGSYLSSGELTFFEDLGLPLLSDEVFATYPLAPSRDHVPTVLRSRSLLVASLGGLSKIAALPQLKLGWIALGGPRDAVQATKGRLELVADTFLSVGTPVLAAAPALLASRTRAHDAIVGRTARNLDVVRKTFAGTAATVLHVEGGWYATLRLPAVRSEEEWTMSLLEDVGVLVHPGHFFDFEDEPFV